jgi:uncharacterized 2Fe-2S/4Fe-4S cluster protein (DUF4445 family)
MSPNPLVFVCDIELTPPSPTDKTADADRLINELNNKFINMMSFPLVGNPSEERLRTCLPDRQESRSDKQCNHTYQRLGNKTDIDKISIPLNILRRLPEALRENDFKLRTVIGFKGTGFEVLDIGRKNIFGLALDIGTTNIECSLFDLSSGTKLDSEEAENPQMKFGSDVLTRVQLSISGSPDDLTKGLLKGINNLIDSISKRNRILPEDIFAMTVAGNTIMSHYFLGLDVRNIPVSPYIPAVNYAVFSCVEDIGLRINKNAVVYIFPNAGSYVGGDILSGIIFSGLYKEKDPVLFIDVGTNVEITLGNNDWIMAGAGAAGPALEGGVAGIGRKADKGTICKVKIDRSSKEINLEVMSGIEPTGICGSGMVDLVSEMFSSKIIDQAGKFSGPQKGVIEKNNEKAFLLYKSEKTELILTEREIQNFLLSKAAMFAFLYVFVRSVGLSFRDINKVFISGALGCGTNLDNAVNIGLLPDMPRDKFIPLGNSSLSGAEMVLFDRSLIQEIDSIASKITYREMNEDNELMNVLQGAMFIPHTDPELLKG